MSAIQLNAAQAALKNKLSNPFLYNLFLFLKLPMAWLAGLKVRRLSTEEAHIGIRYKWLNQNPFKSIYFAALSMAAEMSTGVLVIIYCQDKAMNLSMLVTGTEASYSKKAVGHITFVCQDGQLIYEAVEKAKKSGEGVDFIAKSIGYDEAKNEVAIFHFKWSVKLKG